eukprot:TRINITY_DN2990_c0_g1_i2.p1 TRINITY_DN2990_c0_g1~~TRINITY_DN2990_c0_g1_i2.p1  ORF type:complete len:626 (+),score=173.83 TRINITY_DN2990_c0_g1_i2:38-1879(+)
MADVLFRVLEYGLQLLCKLPLHVLANVFGIACGLPAGLTVGYLIFIAGLPLEVKEPEVCKLGDEEKDEDGKLTTAALRKLYPQLPCWVSHPNTDRVDWINQLLGNLWPHIAKSIEPQIQSVAESMAQKYKPKQVDAIAITKLSLGQLPPVLSGLSICSTSDDELVFETDLKWAGNPNILATISVKGVQPTVQLIDVTFFAKARITLRPLVPVVPCFSSIVLSIMDKPVIDFGLKIVGGDVMAIPVLDNYVQNLVADIVSNMLLWPNSMLLCDLGDPKKEETPSGTVHLTKISAADLKSKKIFDLPDPYLTASLEGANRQVHASTTVQWNTHAPDWSSQLLSLVVQNTAKEKLKLVLSDKDYLGTDTVLGVQYLSLKDVVPDQSMKYSLHLVKEVKPTEGDDSVASVPITGEGAGSVSFELTYRPFIKEDDLQIHAYEKETLTYDNDVPAGGGKLVVRVMWGAGLEGKQGTHNPYLKLLLLGDKRKTQVMENCWETDFNEPTFEFKCVKPPWGQVLFVEAWSKNLTFSQVLFPKEQIGHCEVHLDDVVRNKHMAEKYVLTGSKGGSVRLDLRWLDSAKIPLPPATPAQGSPPIAAAGATARTAAGGKAGVSPSS